MFQWLIVHSVVVAAMAAAVALVCRVLRPGPAARHLLWLVVLIKLLTPPVVSWPWALPVGPAGAAPASPPPAPMPAARPAATRTVVIDMAPEPAEATTAAVASDVPAPAAPAAPSPVVGPAPIRFSWGWLPVAAAWLWAVSGAGVALLNARRILSWRRRVVRALPASQWLTDQVRDLAGSMGVRPPRAVVLPGAGSPMLWGFGAPRLIWPPGLEARLPAEGVRAVLLHELAHLRRRDHWVGWLLLAGGCVWWWHPLFWWVRRRLTREAELACDAVVVGAAPDGRRAYAEALLEVSQRLSSPAAVPALGAAGGRRDLERRLVMIMRGPAARRLSRAGLAGVGVLGLLALPAWTLGEDPKAPPAPAVTPTAVDFGTPAAQAPVPPTKTTTAPGTYYEPVTTYRQRTVSVPVTTYRTVTESQAAPGDGADRDKKLKELEEKVRQLLKEMEELRGQAPPAASGAGPATTTSADTLLDSLTRSGTVRVWPPAPVAVPPAPGESAAEVITLTRVIYRLDPKTAEALVAFLKDNVKTSVLEAGWTKADGGTLTVTTTPEAQRAIGQFIALIRGQAAGRADAERPATEGGPPLVPSIEYGPPAPAAGNNGPPRPPPRPGGAPQPVPAPPSATAPPPTPSVGPGIAVPTAPTPPPPPPERK